MGEDPDAIRRDIEETRERMGDTVEALGYKADVPSRTKEKVSGTMQSMKESVVGTADTISERTPGTGDVKQAARRGAGIAQENPLGLAIGSVAIGFIAGLLIPSTPVENEKLGPMADQVKDQMRETGQQAVEQGKHVAQDVKETAQQSVQERGQQVREHAGQPQPRKG